MYLFYCLSASKELVNEEFCTTLPGNKNDFYLAFTGLVGGDDSIVAIKKVSLHPGSCSEDKGIKIKCTNINILF